MPVEQLAAATAEMAQSIAQAPPLAVALTKRAMNRSFENGIETQMEYEAQLQEILGKTKDSRGRRVEAFLEKRAPQFKGE